MGNEREARLKKWASQLTREQLEKAVVELADEVIMAEDLSFYDSNLAPYWTHSGEPLVEGQKIRETD